jgi:hypothetical protein
MDRVEYQPLLIQDLINLHKRGTPGVRFNI